MAPIIPKHIGLIPDGTRRWARSNGLGYDEAYAQTMQSIARFIRFMYDHQAEALSIYLISKENLRRPPDDLNPVIATETYLADTLLPPLMREVNGRVRCAGNLGLLPPKFAQALETLCGDTAGNDGPRLYLLTAYNPMEELEYALQQRQNPVQAFDSLWVPEPLDLILRTSGEQRTSNFLPLQSGYAELIFTPKHFNDLTETDLQGFLAEYRSRQRRFGG